LARPGSLVTVRRALERIGQPADVRAEALAPPDFEALAAELSGGQGDE
jgi:hypothetical protein